jgi:DNA-directed RNA polymerase specialized sigma24 family protein
MLEEWGWIDRMKTGDEKQRFLEAKIAQVQRDPVGNRALLTFLLVAFEPIRRSVSNAFVRAHSGLTPEPRDIRWANRQEARLIRHAAREELFDVTREGALEAIYRYPLHKPPARFFLWLRETIAHRALEKLTGELPAAETTGSTRAAAEAMQSVLSGLNEQEPPPMRDRKGMRKWRQRIEMRDVFEIVAEFFQHDPVRDACRAAIGRLPKGQREVIDACYYEEVDVADVAAAREVSASTVYNQRSQAHRRMSEDDVFFSRLYALQEVRDHARARYLREAYPDGRLPDGRRLVVLTQEAA